MRRQDIEGQVKEFKAQGLSAVAIASRLGCSRTTVDRILRGDSRRRPSGGNRAADRERRLATRVRECVEYDEARRCGGCGLMLPCHNCPVSIDDYASSGTSPLGMAVLGSER